MKTLKLSIVLLASLLFLQGCGSDKKLEDYLKDKKITECGAFENPLSKEKDEEGDGYIWTTDPYPIEQGIISASIDDFDNDGTDEMLVIEVRDAESEGKQLKSLYATIIEKNGNGYVESATCQLINDIHNRNMTEGTGGECDVFIKNSGTKKLICIETSSYSAWFSDGILWRFDAFSYSDGKLQKENDELFLYGSSFVDGEEDDIADSLVALGFTGDFIDTPIVEAEKDVSKLCNITAWFSYKKYGADAYDVLYEDYDVFQEKEEAMLEPVIVEVNDYSELGSLLGLEDRRGWKYIETE
ncbi:hypothetical protein [Anaerosporobacter sp.]|uniref:hypothetical protein n=1 Tax=Anaerosporobacter sp. TaxID=1872529 RepID=UPI00286F489B|nr:hypothetical protein [Anaerosporobacter sp.]